MPFKKNSPGCVCCVGFAEVRNTDTNFYTSISPTGLSNPVQAQLAFGGEAVNIIGADLKNKYVVLNRSSSDETWTLNPVANTSVAKIYDAGRDVADVAATQTLLYYMPDWGISYGLWRNEALTLSLVVFDANGDYLHGPYTEVDTAPAEFTRTWKLKDFTVMDNGDLYLMQIVGNNVEIRINDEIDYPRGGAASIILDEPVSTGAGARYTPRCIFSDGTTLYIQIIAGTSSLERGIYSVDGGGAMTFIENSNNILPENGYMLGGAYNTGQNRWEGKVILDGDTSNGQIAWFGLGEDESLLFGNYQLATQDFDRADLITRPTDIEDYWDAL